MVVNENGIALALLLLAAGTIDVWLATINARLSEVSLRRSARIPARAA